MSFLAVSWHSPCPGDVADFTSPPAGREARVSGQLVTQQPGPFDYLCVVARNESGPYRFDPRRTPASDSDLSRSRGTSGVPN